MTQENSNTTSYAVGGTALALAGITAIFKKKCHRCRSLFTINKQCQLCNKWTCWDCGWSHEAISHLGWPIASEGRVCYDCTEEFKIQRARMEAEITAAQGVRTISASYKGNVPSPKLNESISSRFHREKGVAERELTLMAAANACNTVLAVEFTKEEWQDGNYFYTVWQAHGII